MFENLHFHDHPSLEKRYGIPEDHVIIDRDSYKEVIRLINEEVNMSLIKKEEEARYTFSEPILRLYPNKFKIISDVERAKEPGLYYFNDKMPDGFIEVVVHWISDVLNSRPIVASGYKNASIDEITFCKRYGYPLGKLNYHQDVNSAFRDYLFTRGSNFLRIHNRPGNPHLTHITLWGDYLKDISVGDMSPMSVGFAGVLMSTFDVLFKEGEQRMLDYLTTLWQRRIIYEGRMHPSQTNLVYIRPSKAYNYYILNMDDPDHVKRDFDYLKAHLLNEG
jgi:phage pi2 protein 07